MQISNIFSALDKTPLSLEMRTSSVPVSTTVYTVVHALNIVANKTRVLEHVALLAVLLSSPNLVSLVVNYHLKGRERRSIYSILCC